MEIKLNPDFEPEPQETPEPELDPLAKMNVLVAKLYKALAEAEAHADTHNLSFNFEPAYGMGGTYYGKNNKHDWSEPGWNPSSQNC